ncbi:MAG: GNAT family N-acetyltransferase [Candidatus Cloacimonetes bacterium]|jgi:predicted N-acetyltransferase YhbS|nr:GNAT family N-acetyltransferase [Candidatus Cloacimonadota bacterium]
MSFFIRTLSKDDDKEGFDCSDSDLNQFFKKFASQNQYKHYIGTTYVALFENKVIGYVTLSASSIKIDDYENLKLKLPKYPLPILRLSRLAVDKHFQNKGIGKELLKFTLKLAVEQKENFGCIGVVVDAKIASASFYEQFGFETIDILSGKLDIRPFAKVMFLSMSSIEKAIRLT